MSQSANAIERQAFRTMGYGLYIVTSTMDEKLNGQVANTVFQVTSQPPQIATSLSKNNLTHEFISKSGVFAVCVIAREAPFTFIGPFGFRSGRVMDKFENVPYAIGVTGCPLITEHVVATIEAKVVQTVDCGTHTLFIGEVIGAKKTGDAEPMTYAWYHEHLKGKTPVDSPTHIPDN